MPAKLYRVNLTQDERKHLLGITRRGQSSGRKVKRCLILCKRACDYWVFTPILTLPHQGEGTEFAVIRAQRRDKADLSHTL